MAVGEGKCFKYTTDRTLNGTAADRIHPSDVFGVKNIHGWASYKKLTEEELYQQADMIVKGKVLSARDFLEHPNSDLQTMYSKIKFQVNEYIRGENNDNELEFLQMGQSDCPMAVDPILQPGEECLLYLRYDENGLLYILGGPQGRYNITKEDGRVINQIDQFNYDSMADHPEVIRPAWTNISEDKAEFLDQVLSKHRIFGRMEVIE